MAEQRRRGGGGGGAARSRRSANKRSSYNTGDSVDNSNEGIAELEEERNALRGTVEDMPDKMDESEIPPKVNDRFEVGNKVGSGSYGSVFMAVDTLTGETVALKIESNKALKQKRKQLLHELLLYKQLQGGVGIPKVVWFGSDKALHGRQTLALELLGPSLSDLFKRGKNRGFSLDTVRSHATQSVHVCVVHYFRQAAGQQSSWTHHPACSQWYTVAPFPTFSLPTLACSAWDTTAIECELWHTDTGTYVVGRRATQH